MSSINLFFITINRIKFKKKVNYLKINNVCFFFNLSLEILFIEHLMKFLLNFFSVHLKVEHHTFSIRASGFLSMSSVSAMVT